MEMHWVVTEDRSAVEKIIHRSNRKPQYIFKHSSICPISSRAYKELANATDELYPEIEINYVDVLAHRDVSNLIANDLGVKHESPQILLVWNNKVVWAESHRRIKRDKIVEKAHEILSAMS